MIYGRRPIRFMGWSKKLLNKNYRRVFVRFSLPPKRPTARLEKSYINEPEKWKRKAKLIKLIHEMNISPSFVVGLGSLLLILVQRIHIASCFYIPRRSKICMHNGLAIVPWLSSSRAPKKGMSPASAAADGNNSNYLKSSVADNNVAEETATLIAGPWVITDQDLRCLS